MAADELAVFSAKLVCGTLAFLLISYLGGSTDRHIPGTMLTFPVLNGIGLVAAPEQDPAALAGAMMPVIAFNGCLCFGLIAALRGVMRLRSTTAARTLSYAVGTAGAMAWFAFVGWLLPALQDSLPSSATIAAVYLAAAATLTPLLWSGPPAADGAAPRAVPARPTFVGFWAKRWARIVFFVVSLFALLAAARISDAAWVGRLSALPLVPLCVLAGLAIDDAEGLTPLRDPILVGPGLAMLFVLPLSEWLETLAGRAGVGYRGPAVAALVAGWALYIAAIRNALPPVARALDRWKARNSP